MQAVVLPPLAPDTNAFTANVAERGFAVARIRYAPARAADQENANEPLEQGSDDFERTGVLIILKSTMVAGLPVDLYSYRGDNRAFPHESTNDQAFDESQFESYRELGYCLTSDMLHDAVVAKILGKPGEDPPAAQPDGAHAIANATMLA